MKIDNAMKSTLITLTFICNFCSFSQQTQKSLNNTANKPQDNSDRIRGIDNSNASLNEQGLIKYMETLSDEDALEFLKSFTKGEIALKKENESEILAEEIKIGCGNNFFSESENQHAMIVRGKWCGDSYFWTPINMGAQILEDAFRNNELFTGECVDRDSSGNLMAKYSFDDGKLTSIVHFYNNGKVFQEFSFDKGIPNGFSSVYDEFNGMLYFRRTYNQGVLNGPFYESYYTDDSNCQKRVDEGIYSNGEKKLIKSVCN